ncbi:hypothetical protein DPMN_021717 [Dreissena polymorpha]|uniref:Uncharacterized protein n=1 Tax=Dreissena polymorpha TaxID=45954 RepID=A0A9D4NPF1_DREPO|nr:hypothetical protein DPMN_021717 [Dreissena polymorpha]
MDSIIAPTTLETFAAPDAGVQTATTTSASPLADGVSPARVPKAVMAWVWPAVIAIQSLFPVATFMTPVATTYSRSEFP